ncbi:MAG: selenium-binding protein SBP56-related protein [Candidatus Sulfotelmatobacter sp.]
MKKVIEIPAEPADPSQLPPLLQGFKAVPPLLTDINLSVDDRFLYASCWGTGEMRQYDVSDPLSPNLIGSVLVSCDCRNRTFFAPAPRLTYTDFAVQLLGTEMQPHCVVRGENQAHVGPLQAWRPHRGAGEQTVPVAISCGLTK